MGSSQLPLVATSFRHKQTVYTLEQKIGEGGYGAVFRATRKILIKSPGDPVDKASQSSSSLNNNEERPVAVKVEPLDKSMWATETRVLKRAKELECRHFPTLLDSGIVVNCKKFSFISMDLLGQNLYVLRKLRNPACFTITTVLHFARETLNAIEELHQRCKFLSRDVKPTNFVIGYNLNDRRRIFMVDFGICRSYIDRDGHLLPSRGVVGWRGTNRYGSLQAHQRLDLSRRDDLESWFYMVVEAINASLPWATAKTRDEINILKQQARMNGPVRDELLAKLPKHFERMLNVIDSMHFETEPDYRYFQRILDEISEEQDISKQDFVCDWEN